MVSFLNNKMKTQNNKSLGMHGFTLIEVMVAVAVLSIGFVGAANLISYNISNSAKAINKTIATNLAQEGLELVRNIRDTNWLSGIGWDADLVVAIGDRIQKQFFCGGLNSQAIDPAPANIDGCGDGCKIFIYTNTSDGSKCYSDDFGAQAGYGAPQATDFYRFITLNRLDASSILATADIKWLERGDARYLTIQEILYNWR